jgi:DNA adenine methylase
MKPIIKWVGGKSQLTQTIKEMLPKNYNRYYEPFLGGAAVLLDLSPKEAYVNDINSELINMYIQVREDVEGVIKYLGSLDWTHEQSVDSKEVYYAVRGLFNNHRDEKTLEQAARFIYLNKHCFNGLYRVNSKGEFNVPFNGKLTGGSFDAEHLRAVSKQLKDVVFGNTDFENFLITAGKNDFCHSGHCDMILAAAHSYGYIKTACAEGQHADAAACRSMTV